MLKAVAKGLTTTLIFFLLAEIGLRSAYLIRNSMARNVPLPFAFGDDYGPIPPWLDGFQILKDDHMLIWKNEPNVRRTYLDVFSPVRTQQDRIALLRRFLPTMPPEFRANPTWEIRLNSEGFRAEEMSNARRPGTVRVVCLGDSWTFGMPVGQDEAYPSRLAVWLRQERPETQYEVLNLGVLGYSSFQGLQLMKTRVLDLHPDIVVIGFGMNDSEVAGYRDKDIVAAGVAEHQSSTARVKETLKKAASALEVYKLLKYEALVVRFRPKPISDYLKPEPEAKGSGKVDYDAIEPWTRVSPRDYEENIRQMIWLAKESGAEVYLVDNELWGDSPYRSMLNRMASDHLLPLVDSLGIINAARTNIEDSLEARLDLEARGDRVPRPAAGKTTVVFRVYRGSASVPKALSIVGSDSQLGALQPNTVSMHDDGTGGDQRAGDGVWSYAATFPSGTLVTYVYTNSGAPERWEGLDVPHIRRVRVPETGDGRPVYLPIETFGRVYMQGDDWHTDAVGYDLIAHAVAREIAAPNK